LGRARLHYFWINKGPWSDIDEYRAFLPGVPPRKPLGANFYPENMPKADFETWVSSLGAAQQEQGKGFFTVIRNRPTAKKNDSFVAVPDSDEYKDELTRAAALLHEVAALTDSASLKRLLAAC